MMRLMARLILRLARRLSTPANREWANAMLHELDSIEPDGAALRWAFGGFLALLRPVRCPLVDEANVLGRARSLRRTLWSQQIVGGIASLCVVVGFLLPLSEGPSTLMIVGSLLTALGALAMFWQLVRLYPTATAAGASKASYRTALERHVAYHTGLAFWSRLFMLVPGYFVFAHGFIVSNPSGADAMHVAEGVFTLLLLLGIPLNRSSASRYRRELEDLADYERRVSR